jgi:phasin family protein
LCFLKEQNKLNDARSDLLLIVGNNHSAITRLLKTSNKGGNMFNLPESSLSPVFKAQLNAQLSFFSDFSQQMLETAQRMNALNVQVVKTLLEESVASAKQIVETTDQRERISIAAGQVQPAAEKIRAYQQQVQSILAESQAGIAKVVETHMPETARATADAVRQGTQKASEEAVKAAQAQKETFDKMTMAAGQPAERSTQGNARPAH